MSNSPLRDELDELGYTDATSPPSVDDVIYIKNQVNRVRKIRIRTAAGRVNLLPDLLWRNLSMKPDITDPFAVKGCLSEGLIPIKLYPVALDEVAFETATSNITSLGSVLGFRDYTVDIDGEAVDINMGYGITGNRFTIHGLAADDYDLSTIGNTVSNETAILEYNNLFWSARQIRNSLVYTSTGRPIIPVYIKWNIPETGAITQVAFTASEINATFGIMNGTSPAPVRVNYAGFSSTSGYETKTLNLAYACEHMKLLFSTLVLTVPTPGLLTTFATVIAANTKYNNSAVYTINANIIAGSATPIPTKTQAFLTARIPKAAYTHLELLQWTKPDLVILRFDGVAYTVTQVMAMVKPHITNDGSGPVTEYFIPLWLNINALGSLGQTIIVDVGYNGLAINNDWSVEHTEYLNRVNYIDPLANATASTALEMNKTTGPVTITIDGQPVVYANIQAMLDDNRDIRLVAGEFWMEV